MKLTSDRQADSMESDGGRHSNSPLSLSIAERSLPIKSPRDQVTKGLVSARIEAYRKQSQRQGNVSHAYPPSFPRARFEEVQTQGNWTSYNAALYNQEHPRTMSLATDASPYTKDISQGSQQNRDAPSQPQAAPTALRPRKVMNLLHQWEDKAGKYDAVNALHPRRAASPRNRSFVAEQPPVNEAYACKTAATQKEVQVPCPKTSAQERVGTSLPRSNILRKEKMEQQPGPFENKALPFAMSNTNNVAKYERSGTVHACSRQSTSHPDKSTAESTCALLEAYEVILPPDKSHTIASSVSFSQARHEANEPSSDPEPIYKDRRSLENQLIEGTIACSPNLDAAVGFSRRGRSMIRQGRHAGNLTDRPDGGIQTPAERRRVLEETYPQSTSLLGPHNTPRTRGVRQRSPSANSKVPSTRSPSSLFHGQTPDHRTRLAHEAFYCRPTELPSNSAYTFSGSPPTQSWQGLDFGRNRSGSAIAIRSAAKAHTTSNPSSEYYSFEQSKPGSAEYHEESSNSRATEAPLYRTEDLAALGTSCVLDAATQTDTVEHLPAETTSGWSDSESMAPRRERRAYHRVPTSARLKRRPGRPTVRKVQVIVSLDGATDLVMDARVRRHGNGGAQSGWSRCRVRW